MKNILFYGIILILASCGSNESESITSNESESAIPIVKIGNLEVMTEDLGEMYWDEAMKACADLGEGWRLPTEDELNVLYENKDEIGGFDNDFAEDYYWCSTEVSEDIVMYQGFNNGEQDAIPKDYDTFCVRAVRTF
jgi:hypothetical protein